jgi:hypothetical protein
MSLKKLGLAIGAIMMIGAIMASSAFAEATNPASQWYVGGSKLASGSSKNVHCGIEGSLQLTGTVGVTAVTLQATGIDCLNATGTASSESLIKQTGTAAQDEGVLDFTGVSFVKPSTCFVAAAGTTTPQVTEIKTSNLASEIWMEGETTYDRFKPASGETFASFGIGGASCSIATKEVKVTGVAWGQTNKTGVGAVHQPVTFSEAIEKKASGEKEAAILKLGSKPAYVIGGVSNTLAGEASFEAKEK